MDAVNLDTWPGAIKKENRNIVMLQLAFSVSNIHPNSVQNIIAMCFHNDLSTLSSDLAKQTAESGLCSWVEMHFWLLKQQ